MKTVSLGCKRMYVYNRTLLYTHILHRTTFMPQQCTEIPHHAAAWQHTADQPKSTTMTRLSNWVTWYVSGTGSRPISERTNFYNITSLYLLLFKHTTVTTLWIPSTVGDLGHISLFLICLSPSPHSLPSPSPASASLVGHAPCFHAHIIYDTANLRNYYCNFSYFQTLWFKELMLFVA